MGTLFKVLGLSSPNLPSLLGLSDEQQGPGDT
jgi:hypothetical protein